MYVNSIKTKHISGRLDGHIVHPDKRQVGVKSRSIILPCTDINSLSQGNHILIDQALLWPCPMKWLLGADMGCDHFFTAPIISKCRGWNGVMSRPGTSLSALQNSWHEIASAMTFWAPGIRSTQTSNLVCRKMLTQCRKRGLNSRRHHRVLKMLMVLELSVCMTIFKELTAKVER